MHQKRRSDAERNQIGQRIKFAPKRTLHATHAGDAAIEQIENARQQNESRAPV